MRIITRAEWGARQATHRYVIDTPSHELWLHHTAGALDAGGNGVWWDDVRGIQNFHMDGRGWSDIAYSFVVGGGQIFEGRGAGIAGGHTRGHNTVSHAICLIGEYEHLMVPKDEDLAAIAWLMRYGREHQWWGELTGPHRSASGAATSCCGRNLIARIPDLRRMAATDPTEENDMGDYALRIMAAYREAGRNPESKAESDDIDYWIKELRKSEHGPEFVVQECRRQLGLGPTKS